MFDTLEKIHTKPCVFETYTAEALWADPYRAQQMLRFHLDGDIDVSSRATPFLDRSANWIINRFDLGAQKSVCDFGCGPGLYTSRFAQSGARVTGIDFSSSSIEHGRQEARRMNQGIEYLHGSYLESVPEGRFDLITMIMFDFCALSPSQRRHLMSVWRACLKEGGAVLLDVYGMGAYADRQEASFCEKNQLNHFWHAEDYYAFVNTFKYDDEAVVLDRYDIFPERSQAETVFNWLQYFSLASLKTELAAGGLQVEARYGNVAGDPYSQMLPEFAVVATRMG